MDKRKELEKIRAQLGELKSEAKPFDKDENITIVQTRSSIAAHGSGEFHAYRLQRNRERERQREMEEEWNLAVEKLEFEKRRKEIKELEEAERLERKELRLKRKHKQQETKDRQREEDEQTMPTRVVISDEDKRQALLSSLEEKKKKLRAMSELKAKEAVAAMEQIVSLEKNADSSESNTCMGTPDSTDMQYMSSDTADVNKEAD